MTEEVKKEELIKISELGILYIETNTGLKIRESIVGRRLEEDGETFEEYKIRQKLVKQHEKNNKSRTVWYSHIWGTLTVDRAAKVRAKMEEYFNNKNKKEGDGN